MYDDNLIIGVAGGSGSGKTFFSNSLHKKIGKLKSTIIYQDNFYYDQSAKFDHDGGSVNFDHPSSLDFKCLNQKLKTLKNNESVRIPKYDFASHSRLSETELITPKKVIIVDGTLILSSPELYNSFDLTIFIETSEEIRFKRRLVRDVTERGRTAEGVKAQFETQVKPMHDKFVEPSKRNAHYISSGTDMDLFNEFMSAIEHRIDLSNITLIEKFRSSYETSLS